MPVVICTFDRRKYTGTIASGSVSPITINLFTAFMAFVFLRTTTNAAMEAKVSTNADPQKVTTALLRKLDTSLASLITVP